jgi:hypothetical protein
MGEFMATDKKSKEIKENVLADVSMMAVRKTAESFVNKYRTYDDQHMNGIHDRIRVVSKKLSTEALPLQYNTGKAVDEKAFGTIVDYVDEGTKETITKQIPTYEDDGVTLLPKEEWTVKTLVVNNHVKTFAALLKAEDLSEAESMNFRSQQDGLNSDLQAIQSQRSYLAAESKAINSEKLARSKAKIQAAMKKRKIKTASLHDMMEARFGKIAPLKVVTPEITA